MLSNDAGNGHKGFPHLWHAKPLTEIKAVSRVLMPILALVLGELPVVCPFGLEPLAPLGTGAAPVAALATVLLLGAAKGVTGWRLCT